MNERENSQLEQVRQNNEKINSLIKQILKIRRKQRNPIEINGEIDPKIEKLLSYEVKKCLEIYRLEFQGYTCQGRNTVTLRKPKKTADCYGGIWGLQVTYGMQNFVDKMILPTMKRFGYRIDENGEPAFDETLQNNTEHDFNSKDSSFKKYVGSPKDQMDYFASFFAKNGVDLDFIWDALAHEEMHTYGVSNGNVFMKEGITEELTREICQKYNIHMSPHAHTEEANFVRKLELLVGRNEVIDAGMWTGNFKEKNFVNILKENPELTYMKLSEMFELLKSDPKKLDKKEAIALDKFCTTYPDVTEDLRIILKEYRDAEEQKIRYSKIAEKFDKELGMKSGSFNVYLDIFENMYSLSQAYKQDPRLYRDMYKRPLDELESDYIVFQTGEEFKPEEIEILGRIRSLFNKLSYMNPQLEINSFDDLIAPIDEKIVGRELVSNDENKDYSNVLSGQKDELSDLQRILDEQLLEQSKDESPVKDVMVTDNGKVQNNVRGVTGTEIGKGTLQSFEQNPGEAIKTMETIERGIKEQEKDKSSQEEGWDR